MFLNSIIIPVGLLLLFDSPSEEHSDVLVPLVCCLSFVSCPVVLSGLACFCSSSFSRARFSTALAVASVASGGMGASSVPSDLRFVGVSSAFSPFLFCPSASSVQKKLNTS